MKMQCVACVLIATIYLVSPVESWLCSPYNRYVLANTTGVTFSSPLYPTHPNSHMMNLYCKWIVRSNTPGRSVIMKIIDANIANSTNCESVFVKSYEGMSPRGPLLNTFCGSELPPPIKSSSGDIFVEFKIASDAKGQGFVAKIYEVPNPTTTPNTKAMAATKPKLL